VTEQERMRISVVIPVYNAEELIPLAIESVLTQTVPPHEIIVVDDGSTDNTWKAVRRYHPKVRYLYQENAGPSVARNTGIEAATGEWVAFVDSDDRWLPQKIERDLEVLRTETSVVWLASNHFLRVFGSEHQFPRCDLSRVDDLLRGGGVFPSFVEAACAGLGWDPVGLLIRRDVLLEAGGFRPGLNYGEDLDLCLTIAAKHPRIGFQRDPAAIHFIDRTDSLSRRYPVTTQMTTLRAIFQRHRPKAVEQGSDGALVVLFRTIVQDQLEILLAAGQRRAMFSVCHMFRDILPLRYRRAIAVLGLLPSTPRRALYSRIQWKIREGEQ